MADETARTGLEGDATQQRRPKIKPATSFKLTGTNEDTFRIGDSAVDVVLTGSGLDTKGLRAIIIDLQPKDVVLIEQPDPDAILDGEFPITVQVVSAQAGQRRFAVTTVPLGGVGVGQTSILEEPIWFV